MKAYLIEEWDAGYLLAPDEIKKTVTLSKETAYQTLVSILEGYFEYMEDEDLFDYFEEDYDEYEGEEFEAKCEELRTALKQKICNFAHDVVEGETQTHASYEFGDNEIWCEILDII